jgi:hypothetical protein
MADQTPMRLPVEGFEGIRTVLPTNTCEVLFISRFIRFHTFRTNHNCESSCQFLILKSVSSIESIFVDPNAH